MQLGINIIFKSYSVSFGTKQWQQHFQCQLHYLNSAGRKFWSGPTEKASFPK